MRQSLACQQVLDLALYNDGPSSQRQHMQTKSGDHGIQPELVQGRGKVWVGEACRSPGVSGHKTDKVTVSTPQTPRAHTRHVRRPGELLSLPLLLSTARYIILLLLTEVSAVLL